MTRSDSCMGQVLLGSTLALFGAWRGSLAGLLVATSGCLLLVDAFIGTARPAGVVRFGDTGFSRYSGGAPGEAMDVVDEASMESFPASDAPAHMSARI